MKSFMLEQQRGTFTIGPLLESFITIDLAIGD